MKNPILTIVMFLVFILNTYSQAEDKTITSKEGKYNMDGQVKTRSEIKYILANNPASALEFHKYRVTNQAGVTTLVVGAVMGCAGFITMAFSMGEEVINGISGEEMEDPKGAGIALAGTGLMIVGAAILISNPHFKRSINLYNSSVISIGSRSVKINLTVNPNGLGMRMTF
jgi:hypothetical protein